MDVRATLTQAFEILGIKQTQFARKIGVAQSTVSKWMNEVHSPNTGEWAKAEALLRRDSRTRHLVGLPPDPFTWVRLLDWVSAGKLTEPTSQIPAGELPVLPYADLGSGEFFALRVHGDSMDRISPEGSIIVVNRADQELVSGKFYVFAVKGETTYKRWVRSETPYLAPFSTNPSHDPIFTIADSRLFTVGRVRRTTLDL